MRRRLPLRVQVAVIALTLASPTGCSDSLSDSLPPCADDGPAPYSVGLCLCGQEELDRATMGPECACDALDVACFDTSACGHQLVADATDVWNALPPFHKWFGPYTTGVLPVTVDLVASTDLEVRLDGFCVEPPDCHPVVFLDEDPDREGRGGPVPDPVTGVSLSEIDDYDYYGLGGVGGDILKKVMHVAAGTRFRLRPLQYDIHPTLPSFAPAIRVMPPCDAPCNHGELRCFADGVCYPAGRGFCYGCTDLGVEVCECVDEAGPRPDGTTCEFWISGDQIKSGLCNDGICDAP